MMYSKRCRNLFLFPKGQLLITHARFKCSTVQSQNEIQHHAWRAARPIISKLLSGSGAATLQEADMAATLFAMRGRVALIRITKPPVNSLGLAVRKGIWDGLDAAEAANAKAIVIAGDGATFPAGADIGEFATGGHMKFPFLGEVIERVSAMPIHTVSAVHGTALGGGMELTLGCHYRLMHEKARFGLPEVHLGLLPGAGGTQRMPRLVGCEAAIQMMTSGAMVSAKKALAAGLADEIVASPTGSTSPSEDIIERAIAFCEEQLVDKPLDPSRVVAARTLADPGAEFFTTAKKMAFKAGRGEMAPPQIVDAVAAAVSAESFEAGLKVRRLWHSHAYMPRLPTHYILAHTHTHTHTHARQQHC